MLAVGSQYLHKCLPMNRHQSPKLRIDGAVCCADLEFTDGEAAGTGLHRLASAPSQYVVLLQPRPEAGGHGYPGQPQAAHSRASLPGPWGPAPHAMNGPAWHCRSNEGMIASTRPLWEMVCHVCSGHFIPFTQPLLPCLMPAPLLDTGRSQEQNSLGFSFAWDSNQKCSEVKSRLVHCLLIAVT